MNNLNAGSFDREGQLLLATLEREGIEAVMLRMLGDSLGVALSPKSLPLPGGGVLEIDGFSASPAVLCQVNSTMGPLTQEQQKSALMDALKLSYAAGVLGNTARRILLFRDKAAARQVCRNPELVYELEGSSVEVRIAAAC